MGYIIEDRITPAIMGYLSSLKAKNRILHYWPKKTINSIEVFDEIRMYSRSQHPRIKQDETTKKIYNTLNIKVSDLEDENYDGIDNIYLGLKTYSNPEAITLQDIRNYIENNSVLDESYTTKILYSPLDLTSSTYTSDQDIISNALDNKSEITFSPEDDHLLTAFALLDVNNVLFETSFEVTYKKVVKIGVGGRIRVYYNTANLNFTFKRIVGVNDPTIDSYLNYIQETINSIDPIISKRAMGIREKMKAYTSTSHLSSINKQLLIFVTTEIPLAETNLVYIDADVAYIKVDGVRNLSIKDFVTFLGKALDTRIDKTEASQWQKFGAFVAIVAIVAVSILTGGAASAGLSGIPALLAFSAAASLTLAVGMLSLALLSKFLVAQGMNAFAAYISGSMQVLGTISTALGVVSIVGSWSTAIATAAAKEITLQTIKEAFKNAVSFTVTSTKDILGFVVNTLTISFNLYRQYLDPLPREVEKLSKELEKTNEELEDYATPDYLKKVNYIFENPYANIYDMNEYIENHYYLVTQGKVDNATTKYYS